MAKSIKKKKNITFNFLNRFMIIQFVLMLALSLFITKKVSEILEISTHADDDKKPKKRYTPEEKQKLIDQLTKEMKAAAQLLEFEHAAFLRDKINKLKGGRK